MRDWGDRLWSLDPWFQRVTEAIKCVAKSESWKGDLRRLQCKTVKVTPSLQ